MSLTMYRATLARPLRDAMQGHRLIAKIFDGNSDGRVPWVAEGRQLTLLSTRDPDWQATDGRVRVERRPYAARLEVGARARFRVRLTPYARTREGKMERILHGEDEWQAFLEGLAARHGFGVLDMAASAERPTRINAQAKLPSVVFTGVLQVTDEDAFTAALRGGIGRNKTHGFGLLLVARVA